MRIRSLRYPAGHAQRSVFFFFLFSCTRQPGEEQKENRPLLAEKERPPTKQHRTESDYLHLRYPIFYKDFDKTTIAGGLTKGANVRSFVLFHQHGGNDIT